MHESVGAIDFLGTPLGVVAMTGTITDVSAVTDHQARATQNGFQQLRDIRIDTYHTYSVWLRMQDGGSAMLQLVNPGVAFRAGNKITAYYVGQDGQPSENLDVVAIQDHTLGKLYDLSARVRLPKPATYYTFRFLAVSAVAALLVRWLAAHVFPSTLGLSWAMFFMDGWMAWWACAVPVGIWYLFKAGQHDKRVAQGRQTIANLIRGHSLNRPR